MSLTQMTNTILLVKSPAMNTIEEQKADLLKALSLIAQMEQKNRAYTVAAKMLNHCHCKETKDYWQNLGDTTVAEKLDLYLQYAEVMKRIGASFIPAEKQTNNAMPSNMECAEAYALAISTLN